MIRRILYFLLSTVLLGGLAVAIGYYYLAVHSMGQTFGDVTYWDYFILAASVVILAALIYGLTKLLIEVF